MDNLLIKKKDFLCLAGENFEKKYKEKKKIGRNHM